MKPRIVKKARRSEIYLTFDGVERRVQFSINPLDESYSIHTLSNSAKPNTTFTAAGTQIYYGNSFQEAYNVLCKFVNNPEIPEEYYEFLETRVKQSISKPSINRTNYSYETNNIPAKCNSCLHWDDDRNRCDKVGLCTENNS